MHVIGPEIRPSRSRSASDQPQTRGALVDGGANVDAYDANGDSLLAAATLKGDMVLTDILVKAGANVGAIDSEGRTILEIAQRVGSPAIVQYLIDAGAE